MNHPRNHFLADAAFAANEYRHIHRRDLQDLLTDTHHLWTCREKLKSSVICSQYSLQGGIFVF